jgi:hypothetical protein
MNAPSLDRRAFLTAAGAFTLSFTVSRRGPRAAGRSARPAMDRLP